MKFSLGYEIVRGNFRSNEAIVDHMHMILNPSDSFDAKDKKKNNIKTNKFVQD